jgi:acyl-CoA thioester hydrolase/1,4-dihydroxy-2-naphthoyl-CoA hydrolase
MTHPTGNTRCFQTKVKIRFRDADPAGILFFGQILGIAHDVFEEFIVANEISWNEWFKPEKLACPIRHTEVDFMFPFLPGHEYEATAKVQKVSQSSFNMHYEFRNGDGRICARVQMVHTFVEQQSFQKAEFPERYRQIFEKYLP